MEPPFHGSLRGRSLLQRRSGDVSLASKGGAISRMGDGSRLAEVCTLDTQKVGPLSCEPFVIYMKDIGFSFYMNFWMPLGHLLCKPYKGRSGGERSSPGTSGARTCACPGTAAGAGAPAPAMRGLVEWRYLRLRAKGGDCVVHEYPEDAEVFKLDFGYRGQRLAAAASEVFAALLKARRDRGDLQELVLEQRGLCALCGTPIEPATEADHMPVHQAFRHCAWSLECHRFKTFLESSQATSLESHFCRHVHLYACRLPKCDPDRVCQGMDVDRPLPQERPRQRTVSKASLLSAGQCPARRGRTPRGPDLCAQEGGPARGPGRAPPLSDLSSARAGTASPRRPSCSTPGSPAGRISNGRCTPPPTFRQTASPGPWTSWRGPGPRARSTWPSSPSTLSSDSRPHPRTSSMPCVRRTTTCTAGAASASRSSSTTRATATTTTSTPRSFYLVALKTEDRLPGLSESLPRKFVHTVEVLTRRRHRDGTPKYRFEEVKQTPGGRVPGAAAGDGAADGAGALAPRGGSRGALPQLTATACCFPGCLARARRTWGGRSCRSSRSSAKGSP